MNDIVVSLMVILATGLLILSIFLLVNRAKRKNAAALTELAHLHGWKFEPVTERLIRGYRLIGPRWTMEALTTMNDNSSEPARQDSAQSTRLWSAFTSLPGRVVLIGPGSGDLSTLGSFGSMAINRAVQLFLGKQVADIKEVQSVSTEVRKRYLVLAQETVDAQRLITPEVEASMTNWKGILPVIKVTAEGLQIEIRGQHYQSEKQILPLVNLAEAILAATTTQH